MALTFCKPFLIPSAKSVLVFESTPVGFTNRITSKVFSGPMPPAAVGEKNLFVHTVIDISRGGAKAIPDIASAGLGVG